MKKLIALMLVCLACFAEAQTAQPDMVPSNGKRAYIDLNPAIRTQIAPGLWTYFAWVKDPVSGNYFKFVSANEDLGEEFDRVTMGVLQNQKRQDSAIVVEGPPLDAIFTKELLYAYENSTRRTAEVEKEKKDVEDAERAVAKQEAIVDATPSGSKRKEAKNALKSLKKELESQKAKQVAGINKRQAEYAQVASLLAEMETAGFVYLKNHALVAISDILTKELPTRVGTTSPVNQQGNTTPLTPGGYTGPR